MQKQILSVISRCCIVFSGVLLLNFGTVSAHTPAGMNFGLDYKRKIVSFTIGHAVMDPEKHYIKSIEIKIGSRVAVKQAFVRQTDEDSMYACYCLADARETERITIKAFCNESGSITKSFRLWDLQGKSQALDVP